ncbi:MAG TPA: hypothetical protein VF790_01950, partial [Dissulfurispiraceae bacterium]
MGNTSNTPNTIPHKPPTDNPDVQNAINKPTEKVVANLGETSGTIQSPFRITGGSYYEQSAPGGSYSYSYNDSYKWGAISYRAASQGKGYGIEYTPDGKSIRYDYTYDSKTGTWQKTEGQSSGTWDTSQPISSQLSSLMGISQLPSSDITHTDSRDDGTFTIQGTIKAAPSLRDPASSIPTAVTLSGSANRNSTNPHLWSAFFTNGSDQSNISRPDVDDAFIGWTLTRETGGTLDGKFIGFYMGNSSNISILRGDLSGSMDASGSYSLRGITHPEQITTISELTKDNFTDRLIIKNRYDDDLPSDFLSNYFSGDISGGVISGSLSGFYSSGSLPKTTALGKSLYFDNDFSSSYTFAGINSDIKGSVSNRIMTISIADTANNATYPSGVFIEDIRGAFTNAPSVPWTAKMGNSGGFGSYNLDKYRSATYSYADGGEYRYSYISDPSLYSTPPYSYAPEQYPSRYFIASSHYERPDQQVTKDVFYYADGTMLTVNKVYHPNGDYYTFNPAMDKWDTTQSLASLVTTPPDQNYTSRHNKDGFADRGYWIADLSGGTWTDGKLSGSLAGSFITRTKLGTLSGDLFGVYDADDTSWIANAIGKYEGTPLKFVSEIHSPLLSYDGVYGIGGGELGALIGGTDSLWTATPNTPVKLTMMGIFSSSDTTPHLWGAGSYSGSINSYNYLNNAYTTYDGGAYKGYLGGIEISGSMEGGLIALYIDPNGNAGYLKGSLSGSAYPSISMDGSAYPIQMLASSGITPSDLKNASSESQIWRTVNSFAFNSASANMGYTFSRDYNYYESRMSIPGIIDWGIWQTTNNGAYQGINVTDTWNWS